MKKTIAAFVTFLSSIFTAQALAQTTTRPNIVVIIADDLGYGETSMQGNRQIPTPGIDSLAAAGVRCTNGYATSSVCSPSRAGLMTGKYQARFGYDLNPIGEQNFLEDAGLPESETTFISRFKDAGYQTALVGKWHLGASEKKHPLRRGFQSFVGFLHEGHYFVPGPPFENVQTMLRTRQLAPGEFQQQRNLYRGNYTGTDEPAYNQDNPWMKNLEPIEEKEYLTDAITREAVAFIESARDETPFAMVVAYNAVHSPMQGLMSDIEKIHGISDPQRKIFAAMLVALDRGVAKILAAIEERGEAEQTLVVFFSDNGGPTRELTSSNAPLRGGKGDLYEGGIRVPMVWSMPGTLPEGVTDDRPIVSVDIAATALSLAGINDMAGSDGVDVVPYLKGEKRGLLHERIYWRMNRGKTALRLGDWKIIRPAAQQPFELYHLAVDEAEKQDLASAQPGKLSELVRAWQAMDSEMAPPMRLNP